MSDTQPLKTKQLTCEQLIDEQLSARQKEWVHAANNHHEEEGYPVDEEGYDFYEGLTHIERINGGIKVELSGGGPADWFEIYFSESGIRRAVYVYQDWYDGASRLIKDEEAIEALQQLFEPWAQEDE